MYKLRIYHKKGSNKGNLDHEELFNTFDEMLNRYKELFNYKNFSLNPTAWELIDNIWYRLSGF